jgi:hypothetical protein
MRKKVECDEIQGVFRQDGVVICVAVYHLADGVAEHALGPEILKGSDRVRQPKAFIGEVSLAV